MDRQKDRQTDDADTQIPQSATTIIPQASRAGQTVKQPVSQSVT